MNKMLRTVCIAASLGASCAHAGPAEDALARAGELQKSLQAQQERIAHLESQLQNQGVIGLLNEVEALKAEIARLRGNQEEQSYQMDVAEKRVKDLFVDLDTRINQIKEMASRPAPAQADTIHLQPAQALSSMPPDAATVVDSDAESRAYAAAHTLVKSGKYKEAVQSMQTFLSQYPSGRLAPNAFDRMGFSQVNLGDFPGAANSYQRLISDYPNSPKAPDAMLSLARARIQSNELTQARAMLEQLATKYPASKAAITAKKLLATLN